MNDSFGDRMKMYERQETDRKFMPGLPVYARIDGRSFSKFTKGMERPYDSKMTYCMQETCRYLVEQTNSRIGYVQSDEISLIWYADAPDSEIFFNGRIFKMVSQLAAMASVKFNQLIATEFPDKADKLPVFDARVFQLPSLVEGANAMLWREQDATKNAISMAAHTYCGHAACMNKTGPEKQEMLWHKGVNFNDYPASFKRGTWMRRETFQTLMDQATWDKIPDKAKPASREITRSRVSDIQMPPFGKVTNRVDVVFHGMEPLVADVA